VGYQETEEVAAGKYILVVTIARRLAEEVLTCGERDFNKETSFSIVARFVLSRMKHFAATSAPVGRFLAAFTDARVPFPRVPRINHFPRHRSHGAGDAAKSGGGFPFSRCFLNKSLLDEDNP
jgi:hypothetical protein